MARSTQGDTPAAGQEDTAPPVNRDPIAIGLQQLFATVADEPVPAEFLDLLDRIDAREDDRQEPDAQTSGAPTARGLAK